MIYATHVLSPLRDKKKMKGNNFRDQLKKKIYKIFNNNKDTIMLLLLTFIVKILNSIYLWLSEFIN